MPASDVNRTIEAVWRIESPRLIAGLARIVRDVGVAEDLAQEALVAALEQWPESGVADNPGAWLMGTAKHRAVDRLRRAEVHERKTRELGRARRLVAIRLCGERRVQGTRTPGFPSICTSVRSRTVPRVVRETDRIVATYFPALDEWSRPTVERLIDVVVDVLPDAQHGRKWGRLTFTQNGDWHHWLCAIAPTKKAVKLLVHKGALLADPAGVLEGEGRYLRAITFMSPEDVDKDVVARILREAAARQTEM